MIAAATLGIVAEAAPVTSLTAGGIAMMTLSIGMVTMLVGFCIYRILREDHPTDHHHAPLDIDTKKP